MNMFRKILKSLTASLVILFTGLVISNATVFAADPAGPKFNFFTDAPGIGAESDFLRIQKADGSRVNTLEQCEGDVNMWFYVHNSQAAANNGTNYDGVGVARGTRLRVQMPTGYGTSREMKAFVSANNATTVSDGASITCNGTPIALDYAGLTEIYTTAPEGYELIGDLTSPQGARLALKGHAGDIMPGCWDHRVRLTFKVKIKKEVKPVVGDGVCKANDLKVVDNKSRKVKVTVNGAVTGQGASIVGYEINWGDGSKSTKQTDEHTYAKDGTYTVKARVQVKLPNGETKWVESADCTKVVTFKADVPPTVTPVTPSPVTPPTGELIKTGPASLAGIFAGTSALSAAAHRIVTRRRNRI